MEELLYFTGYSLLIALLLWRINERYHFILISLSCLLFVGYLDILSAIILCVSSFSTFYVLRSKNVLRYSALLAIVILASIFIYFKLRMIDDQDVLRSSLPLGMSFYMFRLIHCIVEEYKGNLKGLTFGQFLSFIFYLPVIMVGPIIRIADWQKEVKRRRWDSQQFSNGLERILYGLIKIVVFGSYLFSTKLKHLIFNLNDNDSWLANYLDCLSYAGNSYMQFAGFSDIAIGISLLFGIRIMENFNYPFLAQNINEFWKRWHISLSMWCRDYIFMPIASFSRLPWLAILVSMTVLGLWHELSARYILWALFHGMGILIWHFYNKYFTITLTGMFRKMYDLICLMITLNFVIISFVWIKESSVEDSLSILKILLRL